MNSFNIIESDGKIYDISDNTQAINFLIFALNGKYSNFFIDFLFSHLNMNVYEYSIKFFQNKKTNSVFEIQRDVKLFFDFFCVDYVDDNIFYKYIYFNNESDFIKKQKINKIIEGLKKTIEFYFDFHNVLIFWNSEIDKEYDFIKKTSIERECCVIYTYYCVCKILINFYDYLYDEFYSFIDVRNEFNIRYSNKIKDLVKSNKLNVNKTQSKIDENTYDKDIFKTKNIYLYFIRYSKLIGEDFIPEYSYIFQKLLNLDLIHKKKHKEYKEWLCENKFINKIQLELFMDRGSFESLNNLESRKRLTLFESIFEKNEKL